jgi:hypothetical protein
MIHRERSGPQPRAHVNAPGRNPPRPGGISAP